MRILVPPQRLDPRATDQRAVNHNIDLLAMKPALRVLIPVPDNADMFVRD